jgi:ankyrin repeat protein
LEPLDIILGYAQEAHMKGALLDAKETSGNTALHLAISNQYVNVARKLILEGADLFTE